MATEIERLIEAITEEIYLRMAGRSSAVAQADDSCPECSHACHGVCACGTRRIMMAGACRVSVASPVPAPVSADPALAAVIDHTLLKPDATRDDIVKICDEARRFGFASVCVNPYWVPLVAERLHGTAVRVCTVIGFPLGATLPAVKRVEAAEAVKLGAEEVDMVVNVGALRGGEYDAVRLDIRGVAEAAHAGCAILKVILETALLDDEQKVAGCMLAKAAGADFVKTSTGFASGGATVHDVELMRFVVGESLGVKASGGVRSLDDVRRMVSAGATRVGASASVKIMEEAGKPAAPSIQSQPAAGQAAGTY